MKNKKGFTLVELLAVIVVLGIIVTIATISVMNSIEEAKYKARYIAAKEITEIAGAYMETENIGVNIENNEKCVLIKTLIEQSYLEEDVTNPKDADAENITSQEDFGEQKVCTCASAKEQNDQTPKTISNGDLVDGYEFDGYLYSFN